MRVGHAEQRAVAAEHDDEVDVGGSVVARRTSGAGGCRRACAVSASNTALDCRAREPGARAASEVSAAATRPRLATMPTRVMRAAAFMHGAEVEEELDVALLAGDRRRASTATRVNPTSAPAAATSATTRACTAGSRMTPLRTSPRPASNCGFTSATTSAPAREQRRQRRQDLPQRDERDVDDDESTGPRQIGRRQVARVEALDDDDARVVAQPSSRAGRGRRRAPPRVRAPRCSRTSVKPPVEAPMSSASRPATASRRCRARAPASGRRGRRTDDRARPARRRRRVAPCVPALVTAWPSTLTCPARISACARSRDGASPRSTTS